MAESEKQPKTPAKKTAAKKTAPVKAAQADAASLSQPAVKATPAKKIAAKKTVAKKTIAKKTATKQSASATSAEVTATLPGVATSSGSKTAPTHAEIAHLAYIYWSHRDHHHGHDREDWARAEETLRAR